MKSFFKKLRFLFIGALMTVVAVAPAAPASAVPKLVGTGVGVAADFTISLPNGVIFVEMKGKAQYAAGTMVVEFHCEATAVGLVASTGIDACSVGPIDGIPVPNQLPGAYSTAAGAGTFASDGGAPYGCVAGHADWILGGSSSAGDCGEFIWASAP